MKIDEALSEKYRVQKMLSQSATSIHDYCERSRRTAKRAMAEIGASVNYCDRKGGSKHGSFQIEQARTERQHIATHE